VAQISKRQPSGGLFAKPTGTPAIVLIRAGGDKPPLFLIHGVDGTLERFQYLVRQLEPDQPIYGVLSQALLNEQVALMRVEDLATYYIQAIQALRPHGPYHFLGFSFGGLLAFEMAQQLHARGDLVGMLGMLDTLKMGSGAGSQTPAQSQSNGGRRSSLAVYHLRRVATPRGLSYAKDKVVARSLRAIYTFLCARGRPIPRFLRRAGDINWFAAINYTPQPYAGGVTHFQTSASADDPRSTNDVWARLAGRGVEVKLIPGRHEDVLNEPHAESLAHSITECLAKVPRPIPC
jgi:thioesterase domain-containing protein